MRHALMLVRRGVKVQRACERARISNVTFYRYRNVDKFASPAPQTQAEAPASPMADRALVARVIKSNLSDADKISILRAAY